VAGADHKEIHRHLHQARFDFNIYSVTAKDGSACWLLQNPERGQLLFGKSGQVSTVVQPGFISQSFVVNTEQKLNISTSVRIKKIEGSLMTL
jgi:hypothetical protein